MPRYDFMCPHCEQTHTRLAPMDESQVAPTCSCTCPPAPMNRLYGTGVDFTFGAAGREVFHNGYEGQGETIRETGEKWRADARAAGLDPEPVGQRWV